MPSKFYLSATAALLVLVSAATAVHAQVQSRRMLGPNGVPEGYTRVTANINIFVPGPTGDSDEAEKLRDRARRIVYSTAARECDILRETLAQECVLEQITNNLNATPRYQSSQPEGYTVNGSLTFSIKLKKE